MLNQKSVKFNCETTQVYQTYSSQEYNRNSIDHIFFYKITNQISHHDWKCAMQELSFYKCNEMIIHFDSLQNTTLN